MFNEQEWSIVITPENAEVTDSNGDVTRVALNDVTKIFIETDDSGPIGSDVFWYVATDSTSVCYPLGATGEQEALKYFQTLPGFDNGAVIKAMTSTDNNVIVAWEKK